MDAETQPIAKKRKPRGKAFQPGNPGGPGRPSRSELVARAQVNGSLTEAGRTSIKLLASQLQALWERAQARELTPLEQQWTEKVCTLLREELRVRGVLVVELLKTGRHDVQSLLKAFTGEEPGAVAE